ncbi:hypothetical protein, partial [Paenibacillus sp. Y412MC10]|uniref:hypothetical protein n=1 Tax=Geobacillus sp. (strain Y412MC10) TaxID=481743 RepID=UPI0011AB6105
MDDKQGCFLGEVRQETGCVVGREVVVRQMEIAYGKVKGVEMVLEQEIFVLAALNGNEMVEN